MAVDLSADKITLPPVSRIKDAVIEIVGKHNQSIDDIEANLSGLKEDVYGILGYNVSTTSDAASGANTLSVDHPEYATIGSKFTIDGDSTTYTITSKDGSTITINPALGVDLPSGSTLHIKSKIDPEELNNIFSEVEAILNKEGPANDIFDALIALARGWNSAKKVVDTFEVEYNANSGSMDVDLSGYGFGDVSDYNVFVSTNEDKPVVFRVSKQDAATATIKARDLRYFAEDNVGYDGSCEGCSTPVTIAVTYNRTPINFTLTDLEGNTRSVS